MSAFLLDLRYAIRILLKNPGFTSVAVVTLALGIGANRAPFRVIDDVLLRPLPFREPQRLVAIPAVDAKNPDGQGQVSYPAFLDWRSQSHSFEGMSVWHTTSFTYTGGDQPESVPGGVVPPTLFLLLGISPGLGSTLTPPQHHPRHHLPITSTFSFCPPHLR